MSELEFFPVSYDPQEMNGKNPPLYCNMLTMLNRAFHHKGWLLCSRNFVCSQSSSITLQNLIFYLDERLIIIRGSLIRVSGYMIKNYEWPMPPLGSIHMMQNTLSMRALKTSICMESVSNHFPLNVVM